MENTFLIIISALILVAYIFDLTSSKTRLPSVVMLLFLGWLISQVVKYLQIGLPNLEPLLPVLGTIGLILIVLEGSLDLELSRKKSGLVLKSFFSALIGLIVLSSIFTWILYEITNLPIRTCLLNSVPFCVISSAIAIPSARGLESSKREFIIYESSFSDILGIILFNSLTIYSLDSSIILMFIEQVSLMGLISLAATILLFFVLSGIDHPVKFTPIIFAIILVYAISKTYHLPALILVFIFGLLIGNISHSYFVRFLKRFDLVKITREILRFRDVVGEATFVVRSLFFLLFGFLIQTEELFNLQSLLWSSVLVTIIYIVRFVLLYIFRLPVRQLMFIAPRGLISVLLFLLIPAEMSILQVNRSLVIQVVVITSLLIMGGSLFQKQLKKTKNETNPLPDSPTVKEIPNNLPH